MRTGFLLSTLAVIFMAGCGGGGGGGAPAPSVPTAVIATPVIADVSTGAATNVTDTLASLNGYFVNSAGRTTEAWFEWGTTASYGNYTGSTYYGYAGGVSQSKNISGLALNTPYHYIFCVKNADGKVCGADKTFTPSPMQANVALVSGLTNPKYFAVDSTNAYWLLGDVGGSGNGSILSMPLAGGAPTSLAMGLSEPFALAVDASRIYWTEQSGGSSGTGALKSAPLTGGTAPYSVLASGLNNPQFVVVSGGYVYFSEFGTWDNAASLRLADGSIKRVPVGGGVVELLASGLNGPQSLKVDANRVYWTEVANYTSGAGSVMSLTWADPSATPPIIAVLQTLVSGLTGSQYIAIDAANVYYWSAYGTLSSVPLTGAISGSPIVQIASGINGTPSLSVDASSIYWAEAANGGALKRLTKSNGNVSVLTSGFERPDWIAVDASTVYWMRDDLWNGSAWSGLGAILKTAK